MGTGDPAVRTAPLRAGWQNQKSHHNRDCCQTLHAVILRLFSNV